MALMALLLVIGGAVQFYTTVTNSRTALFEIRQQAAIRDLTPAERATISAKLSKFEGQQFDISVFPVNFETIWMSGMVAVALGQAHWTGISLPPTLLTSPPPQIVLGILIQSTPDERSKAAARGAVEALGPIFGCVSSDAPLPEPEHPRVSLLIGDKSATLRSWVKP
jgi:hypothetical protein